MLHGQGQPAAAEPLYRRALAIQERELGDDHPKTLGVLGNLAGLLSGQGDLSAAEPLMRRSLAGYREIFGDQHERVATRANNLGLLLVELEQFEEAEELTRESLAIRSALRGEDATSLTMSWVNVGYVLYKSGDLAAAESSYSRAVTLASRGRPGHPQYGVSSFWYGKLLSELGRAREAAPNLRRALTIYRDSYGEQDAWSLDAQIALGGALSELGESKEAEELLLDARAAAEEGGEQHLAALEALAVHYEAVGRGGEARENREQLEALTIASGE